MKTNHPFTFTHTIIFLVVALIVLTFVIQRGNIFQCHHAPDHVRVLLPGMKTKPVPKEITFHGCPPEGEGGDYQLNLLKNRVDEANYQQVKLESVLALEWPKEAERRKRAEWPERAKEEISVNEGIPVSVEGYLLRIKEEGPESPNCKREEADTRDFHIWLASGPDEEQAHAVVVEATPRVRENHAGWTLSGIRSLIHDRKHVRVSGWLLFDQEHPDQVGKSRGTVWEIHPIMKIEVEQNGGWQAFE